MRARRMVGLIAVVVAAGVLSGSAPGVSSAQAVGVDPVSVLVAPAVPAPAAVPVPEAVPAPAAAPAPAVPARRRPVTVVGTPCLSTSRACIDLSANQAWLIRDGKVDYGPVPITSGRKGFRTPTGTFRVSFKNRDHVSSIYDAPMPYSVFFNGGIAFHQGSLREKSHGCIHLSRKAAKTFFGSLRKGDVVQVAR